jgi:uncharacterized membrane protein YhaH (DUF805 family)
MLRYLFSFHGRSSRLEFWANGLVHVAVMVAVLPLLRLSGMHRVIETGSIDASLGRVEPVILALFLIFAAYWTSIAVAVRRFHDRGKSGFWLLGYLGPSFVCNFLGAAGQGDLVPPLIYLLSMIGVAVYYVELGFLPGVGRVEIYERPQTRPQPIAAPIVARLEPRRTAGFGRRS